MQKLKTLSLTLLPVLALSLGIGAAQQPSGQGHPQTGSTKASQSRGDGSGPDENIKHDRAPNDPNAKIEAPPEKGGPKTRGRELCRAHIDNRTPYYADVYTDGNYRGEIEPFGDLIGYVECGSTTFYARAVFRDGSSKTWGPSVYFVDGSFTWSLTY